MVLAQQSLHLVWGRQWTRARRHQDFYVDDGLMFQPTDKDAVKLIKRAQAILTSVNLCLHKVASNFVAVMEAFLTKDWVKDVREMDLRHNTLPPQRSLGVQWDLQNDTFTFSAFLKEEMFTHRGVLSVVNSVYLDWKAITTTSCYHQEGKTERDVSWMGWPSPRKSKAPVVVLKRWTSWIRERFHTMMLPSEKFKLCHT